MIRLFFLTFIPLSLLRLPLTIIFFLSFSISPTVSDSLSFSLENFALSLSFLLLPWNILPFYVEFISKYFFVVVGELDWLESKLFNKLFTSFPDSHQVLHFYFCHLSFLPFIFFIWSNFLSCENFTFSHPTSNAKWYFCCCWLECFIFVHGFWYLNGNGIFSRWDALEVWHMISDFWNILQAIWIFYNATG